MATKNKKVITKKIIKKGEQFDKKGDYKNTIRIAMCVALTALIVSFIALFVLYNMGYRNTAYTIYLGSADKDTGKTELSVAEAKERIAQVFQNEGEGFTLYTADGGYMNGEVYDRSLSYVVYTSISTKKKLVEIMGKLGEALNTTGVFAHRSPSISYYTEIE